MKIRSITNDFLVCRTWDGTTLGTVDIRVARPPEIRETACWRLSNQTFSWYDVNNRISTVPTANPDTENQSLIPPYQIGDIIYASKPKGGTGIVYNGVELEYMDENRGGRAFAKIQ